MTRLKKNLAYLEKHKTAERVQKEIDKGIALLNSIDREIITFFGSHRVEPKSVYYQHAKHLAQHLGMMGYAIASGGGPGIMRAANEGAMDANTDSIAIREGLIKGEAVDDAAYTDILTCDFLFVRRFILSLKSEALIFYPGGYGTLNELFEYVVLIQTQIADKVPVICVNREYWKGMFDWIDEKILKGGMLKADGDRSLIKVVDTPEEVIGIIERSKAGQKAI